MLAVGLKCRTLASDGIERSCFINVVLSAPLVPRGTTAISHADNLPGLHDATTGAGEDGLQTVKQHPFFTGVDWETLWEQPAPAFAQPQRNTGVDEVLLELCGCHTFHA